MCLNSGGGNDNGQIFSKDFLEGEKMTEGITVYHNSTLMYLQTYSLIIIYSNSNE